MVCGNKYNGFKIDVWRCGIIIFAMICGYLPFEDPNNEILFKKIMKCKVDYPGYLSEEVLDILNKIIVIDPNKRINIEQIKRHPFYLKGQNEFRKKHKDLIDQVEFIENNDSEDNNMGDDVVFNNDNFYDSGMNIKKSKSSNLLKEFDNNHNDVHLFQFKKQLQKFKLEKNIIKRDNINNSVKHKESINVKNRDKLREALMNKFKMNNGLNKVLSNKIRLKETNEKINNSLKNIEKNIFERIDNKDIINSDLYNSNALNDLSSFNTPLSDDLRMKYSEINSLEKKIFYSNSKNKVNLNILNQLLNKEKLEKYFDEKKLMISKPQKTKDSLSYVLPYPQKKKSEVMLPNKTEYKNKINNKSQKRLDLIKFGISNKDANDLFLYNNKEIQRIYQPNTTKNKVIEKNALTSVFNNKNLHIKNLRILNNNNYNSNVENITNINNVKNIIIYNNQNSPIKSIIKDVQYLTNTNNDLPSINTKILKENRVLKNQTKDIKRTKIIKTNNIYIKNNNILIPKILLSKENSNVSLTKNYNTQNVNKLYFPSKNKKFNEIHKNLNKKNNQKLINKYKSSACSIDNMTKKALNKKQISERTINSYGYGSDNSENNSVNKLRGGIYSVKNKNNLNKVKNYNIFNIKNNKDNMIILKKLNQTNK
jgi:hypothetical protein